jgi:fibronectin type 3 domain-containing protein
VIQSATLSGAGFTMSGATFPVTLNPGLALTLDVQFDPISTGAATGTLSIQSTSSTNGMAVVSLSGAGIPHQVALSWNPPDSSTVPITSYNTYRLTAGSSAYQLLNSSVGPQTTYLDKTVQSGITYDYIVTSVDSTGVEGIPSNVVAATIP